MGYTVYKRDMDHRLRKELKREGITITREDRGEERSLDDLGGLTFPGNNIFTDYCYIETSDNQRTKAVLDNMNLKYYDPANETISGPGCLLLMCLPLLFIVPPLILIAQQF